MFNHLVTIIKIQSNFLIILSRNVAMQIFLHLIYGNCFVAVKLVRLNTFLVNEFFGGTVLQTLTELSWLKKTNI